MTYTSILVHIDQSADSLSRIRLVRDLAGRFEARVVGICAAEPSDATLMGGLPPAVLAKCEAELKDACATQRDHFYDLAGGARTEWRSELASPREFLRRSACMADLVTIGRAPVDDAGFEFHLAPADAVMAAGRAVLIVPRGVDRLSADRVVVAWKTGRPAALAVELALPLLMRAQAVTVLGVGEEGSQSELDDVHDHLRLHGVAVETRRREAGDLTTDRAIVETAQEIGADLIVCGAYGRSQLFEWVLGGVTEGLLADSPVCCLMVH